MNTFIRHKKQIQSNNKRIKYYKIKKRNNTIKKLQHTATYRIQIQK